MADEHDEEKIPYLEDDKVKEDEVIIANLEEDELEEDEDEDFDYSSSNKNVAPEEDEEEDDSLGNIGDINSYSDVKNEDSNTHIEVKDKMINERQNKKLKILVGNGRPGLGKSTVAMQVVAPFLFSKNGNQKNNLYTFEVSTDNYLFDTHILNAVNIEVKENSFDNSIINLLTKNEFAVYDIGGGKTTNVVMNALVNTGLIFGIDLFIIPLTDGKHEATKAKEFYDLVKKHNPYGKIIFALNKVAPNTFYDDICMQYIDFLGDRDLMIDSTRGIIEDILPEDRNFIYVHNDDIIKYSIRNNKTVFELAFTDTDELDTLLREAFSENDVDSQKHYSIMKNNISKAKRFFENTLQPAMTTFEDMLGR